MFRCHHQATELSGSDEFVVAVITPNRKQEEDLQVNIHVNPNLDDMSVSQRYFVCVHCCRSYWPNENVSPSLLCL